MQLRALRKANVLTIVTKAFKFCNYLDHVSTRRRYVLRKRRRQDNHVIILTFDRRPFLNSSGVVWTEDI